MTVVAAPPGPRHLAPRPPRTAALLIIGALVTVTAALALPDSTASRYVVAVLIGLTLLAVAVEDEADGVLAVMAFLIGLGLVRRLTSTVLPDPNDDPLLLVAPSMAAALCLFAVARGALRPRTPLLLMTAGVVALTVAGVLNTTGASMRSNAQGLLFWTVPMLWFPVGRLLGSADVRRLLRGVAIVGGASCALGLYQVLVDLPWWDQRWFDVRGYAALGVNGPYTLHPWGFSPSHTEFAQIAGMVLVIAALELRDSWRTRARGFAVVAASGMVVSAAALALSGVRTAQLLTGLAVVALVVASTGVRPRSALLALAAVALLVVGSARVLDVESWSDGGVGGLVRRSLLGFADPLDPASSTLRAHVDLTREALGTLDDRPLGSGTAFGTLSREGEELSAHTAENDFGNAALAFGVPGLLLVIAITAVGLQHAWRRARHEQTVVALAVLTVLILSLRYWWTGAHYATAMGVWLLLGFTDRPSRA